MSVLAHGGAAGVIVEAGLVVTILGVFLAVWLRERRGRRSRSDDEV